MILSFIWPPIGSAIQTFSQWAAYQNPVVAFGIYGFIERCLVPFGLHHIWNVPFQMQIGEYTNAAGQVFHGDIPRYMAGDPTAGMLSGGFLFKMYGLPAAAIAIWHSAKPENRAKVGGIMISAALTSFLTGITEPIEFSFMFVAPVLYVIHALLTGLSVFIASSMHWISGFGFSAGFVDMFIQSRNPLATQWYMLLVQGLVFFGLYYAIFRAVIVKFNLKTPGREDDEAVPVQAQTTDRTELARQYLEVLGGQDNLVTIDACITRLRLTLKDRSIVDGRKLKALGAAGVVKLGEQNLQVILGPLAEIIAGEMKALR